MQKVIPMNELHVKNYSFVYSIKKSVTFYHLPFSFALRILTITIKVTKKYTPS